MFTHMTAVKKEIHEAHGAEYALLVFQIEETGEYKIFIAKDGFDTAGHVFTASQEAVQDAGSQSGIKLIDELISIAKNDIDRNEYGLY